MGGTVGINAVGTFTDIFYSEDGFTAHTALKAPSTPHDLSVALVDALCAAEIDAGTLNLILYNTTIATNAVIERRGARCALITTCGIRDVRELGRMDRPHMYGLTGVQNPIVPRDHRWFCRRLRRAQRTEASARHYQRVHSARVGENIYWMGRGAMKTRVGDITSGRAGDKRSILDLTLVAKDDAAYARIERRVTGDVAQLAINQVAPGPVHRYEVPGLNALKFVAPAALPGGVYATLHAGLHWQKTAIWILLDLEVDGLWL